MLGRKEGTYSQSDYHGDSMVNISLKEPVKLEVQYVHVLQVFYIAKRGDIK